MIKKFAWWSWRRKGLRSKHIMLSIFYNFFKPEMQVGLWKVSHFFWMRALFNLLVTWFKYSFIYCLVAFKKSKRIADLVILILKDYLCMTWEYFDESEFLKVKCVTDWPYWVAAILLAEPFLNIDSYGQLLSSFSLEWQWEYFECTVD